MISQPSVGEKSSKRKIGFGIVKKNWQVKEAVQKARQDKIIEFP